ncbi:hypothetical protein [Arcticibacter sp. MXS-1]|uniref:hypothetical protein n=1 Tax=Arcticibacter sp. MXS-1 TaxID=3341726 RepID=UPI0035A818CC
MRLDNISYKLTFSALLLSAASFAQTKPEEKKTDKPAAALTEEIVVERPYKPVLADAAKIRRSPDLNSARALKSRLNYSILNRKLELNSEIRQLQAQPLSQAADVPPTNSYAKLGLGNYSTGLAELYVNTGADEAMQAGFFVKHLNQEGKLPKQQFSKQEIGIFGKSVLDKITLNGEAGFDRFASYYYGTMRDSVSPINSALEKQRYGTLTLRGELLKNYTDSATSDYALKADAYLMSDKFNAKENSLALSGFFNMVWKQFNVGVNTSLDVTSTKDSLSIGNHIFKANPYLKLQGETYKLAIGVNLVQEFGTNSRFNFFPAITAEMPIVPEYVTLFGGFTGDVNKSTLRNFSIENPYLSQNIGIANAVEKTNIYGGIKGNAGAGFGYKAMVFYKKINDMPLFRNNRLHQERFDVVYDDAKVTGLEGEINVRLSETVSWLGRLNINTYSMDVQEKAWFQPEFRLVSNARVKIKKQLTLDGEIVVNDQTYGLAYNPDVQMVKVKSYVDFSAGAEYLYKEKFGFFLRANNIFGTKYERYLYYPKVGLNIIGGVNYSF